MTHRNRRGGIAHRVGQRTGYVPKGTPKLPLRQVACPKCGAAVGEPCLERKNGGSHRERRKPAVELYLLQRNET